MSNPVHTSETRMCGGGQKEFLLPGGQYIARGLNQVQPFRLINRWVVLYPRASFPSSSMPSVTHSIAFQATCKN